MSRLRNSEIVCSSRSEYLVLPANADEPALCTPYSSMTDFAISLISGSEDRPR